MARYGWICHAYVVMDNHYHALLETPLPNLSLGMRQLNGLYAQWLTVRHDRTGHVFGGRFKSIAVERDEHFLEAARYIVLNPLRTRRLEPVRRLALVQLSGYGGARAVSGVPLSRRVLRVRLRPSRRAAALRRIRRGRHRGIARRSGSWARSILGTRTSSAT